MRACGTVGSPTQCCMLASQNHMEATVMGVIVDGFVKNNPDQGSKHTPAVNASTARKLFKASAAVGQDSEAGSGSGQIETQVGGHSTEEVTVADPIEVAARRIAKACGAACKPV